MSRVLVVEDEVPITRLLRASLSVAGHDVRIASNLMDALEAIREDWPDVVTLDLKLGEDDGSEVATFARRNGSRARFVILSAVGAHAACRRLGADAWLAKPFDPFVLNDKIDELLLTRTAQNTLADA